MRMSNSKLMVVNLASHRLPNATIRSHVCIAASCVVWRRSSCYKLRIFDFEPTVNRKEIEQRIWGKSIASARKSGLISDHEAKFLIEAYLRDFRSKNGWDGKAYIA